MGPGLRDVSPIARGRVVDIVAGKEARRFESRDFVRLLDL
jgi:hypothetical protein